MRRRDIAERTLEQLRTLAADLVSSGTRRFPPARILAQRMDVSLPTVLQAIGRLRSEGLLTASPGRGTRLVQAEPATHAVPLPAERASVKWQRVRNAIAADVLSSLGSPNHVLPPTKQLCTVYGASRLTVRKALVQLVREGVLRETPRGMQPTMPVPETRNTIVLLALGTTDSQLTAATTRTADHLRALEGACGRTGVSLSVVTCGGVVSGTDIGRVWRQVAAAAHGAPLGVLVWAVGSHWDWQAFLQQRPSAATPVALLDEVGDAALLGAAAGKRHVRIFSMAHSAMAGFDVGRWLVSRGHQRVAFFSADHRSVFSQNRLAGLVSAYESCGLGGHIIAHTEPDLYHTPEVSEALADGERLVREAAARVRASGRHRNAPHRAIAAALSDTAHDVAFPEVEQWVMRKQFATRFEQTSGDTSVTAWVGVTDQTTLACREFLRSRGRTATLVGFDNSALASAHGFSSYDFNGAAVMQAMVSYVLEPRWKAIPDRQAQPVEVAGYVVPRRTVSPR